MSIKDRPGDTIIEVLVVLTVLGLAISISYATANRSLLNARQAQEHAEAARLVETQIENLRLLSYNSTPGNTDAGTNIFLSAVYCIPDPTDPSPIDTDIAHNCSLGLNGLYRVYIINCDKLAAFGIACSAGADTFMVTAQWPNVFGQGNDTVTMNYRAHSK